MADVYTDLQTRKESYTFTWEIKNFLFNTSRFDVALESPQFYALPLNGTKWILYLYPKGCKDENYMSCFLTRMDDSGPKKIRAVYSFAILTGYGNESMRVISPHTEFKRKNYTGQGTSKLWQISTLFKNRNLFFPEGAFTIKCHIELRNNSVTLYQSMAHTVIEVEEISIARNLKLSILNSNRADFILLPFRKQLEMMYFTVVENNFLFIFIKKLDINDKNSYFMKCKLSFLDGQELAQYSKEADYIFHGDSNRKWQFPIIDIKHLEEEGSVLVNGELNLLWEFSLSDGKHTPEIEEGKHSCSLKENDKRLLLLNNLSEEVQSMRLEKDFCDVTLRSEDKSFSAHRAILSTRSPVFKKMFQNDMSEKKCGIVDIQDIGAATIEILLKYMYSGKVGDLDVESAMKLYSASDKYEVLSLNKECSGYLKENITPHNVVEILKLSDMHQDTELKLFTQYFIIRHPAEVLASEGWNQLIQKDKVLATAIMRKLTTQLF